MNDRTDIVAWSKLAVTVRVFVVTIPYLSIVMDIGYLK